ncbi:uncharacterized protein SETTUDRAFT_123063 [Exserohilum turcica Et28A]|uniref:F-box domain-containing protein n=1 Tax=Exserohilum turcicum (strain 28A) TaxID=671987 RepID=R0JJ61_EXST2|nr:uncharacterized protein SETTUDRAFT_123063 [Exserohilum turcica Et28A]EOA81383.1 hypothetical protein SETTUDRAFT_123063 [Exserohilum turcica Et28A]
MDDLLPSYESVMRRDPWILVAPYLPSQDLCSAALVCRSWHAIFTPNLWGSPASHFGVQNDTVYVALTRFKRTLPYVRPFVRELTHTLRFPPAHAEIYDGPHAEWLRDCLEYLPRLQCLIVNGLPFFDHACLLSLRYPSLRLRSIRANSFPVFGLRLLDASGCTNATSTGLAEALPHFPDLVSLDLSKTPATRDKAVLSALRHIRNLRVLNLRGLGLKDEDFWTVAHSIRSRVRSLDISDNYLTDTSTRLLLELCLKETVIAPHAYRGPLAPVEQEQTDNELDLFESENLVGHLRKKLTEGFIGTLTIEKTRDVGISYLYLSKNAITIEGISGLLRSGRLQVLDAGTLAATIRNPYPTDPGAGEDDMELPSVAKLIPIISKFASHRLRYIRLNYQVVTGDAYLELATPPRVELCGDPGIYNSAAHELEAVEPRTAELHSESAVVHEMLGDLALPVELHGSYPSVRPPNHASSSTHAGGYEDLAPQPSLIKRRTANTPEPLLVDPLTPMRLQGTSSLYLDDRRARLEHRQSQERCLHPGMVPNLHTLVLTDVPITTEKHVVDRIIQFIKDAAEETLIAKHQARHTYMLPPGRRRAVAEEEYARGLFALRRIVLEMAAPQSAPKKISTSWRAYPTRSTTEDADSEAFWEQASHDFSFFGDQECGQFPDIDRTLPLAAMSGLELAGTTNPMQPVPESTIAEAGAKRLLDVVEEVAKFRRERKAAYSNLVLMGQADPDLEGYWPGDITVMRKPVNPEAGELDCYGNHYESGWFYR